jgi:hypothetical protein
MVYVAAIVLTCLIPMTYAIVPIIMMVQDGQSMHVNAKEKKELTIMVF